MFKLIPFKMNEDVNFAVEKDDRNRLLFYICYVEMNIAFVVVPKEAFLGKACDRTRTPCTRLRLPRCAEYNALKWQVVVSTMSAKSPWNTHIQC